MKPSKYSAHTEAEEKKRQVYIASIAEALNHLSDQWIVAVQRGQIDIQLAVQIGQKLAPDQQERFYCYIHERHVEKKHMRKLLHAYSLHWEDWAVEQVHLIFKLASRIQLSVIMFNDLMDRFERLQQQFEFEFWDGELPTDEQMLGEQLHDMEHELNQLLGKIPADRSQAYNSMYGDSSGHSMDYARNEQERKKVAFAVLVGAAEGKSRAEVRKQARELLKKLHPDKGGSAYLFDWVKKAYDQQTY